MSVTLIPLTRSELEAMPIAALAPTADYLEAKARIHEADPDWTDFLEPYRILAGQLRDELARRLADPDTLADIDDEYANEVHDEQRAQEAYA